MLHLQRRQEVPVCSIQMGSSLALASEQHDFSCVGWGTVVAALGSRVQPYHSNARLAVAALPKRDCCECSITWANLK